MSDEAAMLEALGDVADGKPVNELGLIGQLMHRNHMDYIAVTNRLAESHEDQIADLKATLGAIRLRIGELFAGGYMPTETAIMSALYPSDHDKARAARGDTGWGLP